MHKVIKILILTSVFCNFGFALFEPIYAIFVEQIGGYILEAATAMGIFSIVMGLTTTVVGRLADRDKLKPQLVVLGYGLVAMAFLGYYFMTNPIELFIVQAVIGFGTALIDPAWNALFGRCVRRGREASEWGLWEGGKEIGVGIASIIGGVIAFGLGFKTLILIMFFFEVLATISVSRLLWVKEKDMRIAQV